MTNEKRESTQKKLKLMTDKALEALCKSLENGKSAELIRYLDVMSRFPKYSFRNLLLILSQRPDATHVMGYKAWKELGRQVKKGEKAIRIFAPMKIKRAKDESHTIDKDEDLLLFRPVSVFDESQTIGEALPELSEVSGEPGEYLKKLKAFTENKGIRLSYEENLRAQGMSKSGEIVLKSGLLDAAEFHTLSHELAHELIHSREIRKNISKRQAETEAEAVAFVVSRSVGLFTATASSDYIQLYNGNKETLSESLAVIQKTAAEIIEALF